MTLFCQNCNKYTPHTIEHDRSTSFLGKICELLLGEMVTQIHTRI
ncbi:conserved hypothetical protein [Vibrio chagasii]|nr:hypothetical protein EDB35_12042 [Vibrio crassostreae]CAH7163664.1 conserved hypothetical protein [Vibrio chagasii]TCT70037.1 hypothetical protein EDB46_11480 [Vibrio crassostreae]TCU06681.1 hypothetical protein EDB32_11341 [Vibrio crassostreae]CAH7186735.1 conserved hypothetical protein [Vibrio chagasii]